MKPSRLFVSVAFLVASAASAQQLECPGAAGRSADAFHYHVSMYRPDTRGFLDVWGVNAFASQSACDSAREAQMKRNLAVVDYWKRVRGDTRYEPDRFGTCHADLSTDKTNPRFLTDQQRLAQIRGAEEVRERVRERLLDSGITTDSEIFKDVALPPPAPPVVLGGAKLVPMPQNVPAAQTAYVASNLRDTRSVETAKSSTVAFDLPLVDAVSGASAPAETPQAAAATTPAATPAAPSTAPPTAQAQQPASQPPAEVVKTVEVPAEPAPAAPAATAPEQATTVEATTSLEEDADSFIAYETQRIQNVLKASSVIADSDVKSKIYDACMQRIQLLSNLRALIEASGTRSRLATMARTVRSEEERLAFVSKLFGPDIKGHWAPADATDVIIPPRADVDNDIERVLRDGTGKYNEAQKKRALYLLLARAQPTEDQQLWLTTVADTFLQ